MNALRSPRVTAALLLGAAILALVLANLPAGQAVIGVRDRPLGIPALGLDLTVGQWISDGLLTIFFFLIAIELKHELTRGELASPARALAPAIAALGGVVVPAAIFLVATAGSDEQAGWPIPTATDIAFALGILAIFGRGLPSRVRAFLLALAVLDDLIAIVLIAVVFAKDPEIVPLLIAAVIVAAFGLLSREWVTPPTIAVMIVLGVLAWYLVHASGIHATIAGVALGLVMKRGPAARLASRVEPISNVVILPLFAFSAALVVIPQVSLGELSPAFWGILIALPIGKLVGIVLAGSIASHVARRTSDGLLQSEVIAVAALGGIGFTVSLLMNELAFADQPGIADQGTLGVLLGSGIAIVLSAIVVSALARRAVRASTPGELPSSAA